LAVSLILIGLPYSEVIAADFDQGLAVTNEGRKAVAGRHGLEATLLCDRLGLDISEGALVNKLLGGTILQSDETGLRVGKRNW